MKLIYCIFICLVSIDCIAQSSSSKYFAICKPEIQKSDIKGATLEPLKVISTNTNDSSQIVKYTFDIRPIIKASFANGNISVDSFKKIETAFLLDTINLSKWEKSNELFVFIQRFNKSWKIIPDFDHSGKFDDDPSFVRNDDFFNRKNGFLFWEYEFPFWYNSPYKRKIEFFVAPNTKLPKKYTNALFNTWGGARKIMTGSLQIGIDSFLLKVFLSSEHTYYTRINTSFSISNANENTVNLFETGFPIYNWGDSIFVGNKIIMLDTISILGDTISFKQVGENIALQGVQPGATVKKVSGQHLANRTYEDIHLSRSDGKYTLLHFWGSWCGPCIANLPKLVNFAKDKDEKVEIIGFPFEFQRDTSKTKKIIEQYNLQWRQIVQLRDHPFQRPDVVKQLFIEHFPTYMLVDNSGKILVRSSSLDEVVSFFKN